MKSLVARWGTLATLLLPVALFGQSPQNLLAAVEQRVKQLDSLDRTFSGSFHQRVHLSVEFGDTMATSSDSFAIRVKHGIQDSRKAFGKPKEGAERRYPPNTLNVLSLRNALLPFRAMGNAEITVELAGDSVLDGALCDVIRFDFHGGGDSSKTRGSGRLWVRRSDATPLRSNYDLMGSHPRRGDFISTVDVHTASINQFLVIAHNHTRIRFSLNGADVGHQDTDVANSHFSTE